MTTSVPPKTEEHELDEPSFPIVYVTDLLKAFVKAVRATQMYLPNNPMHARALDVVKEAFSAVWQHTDELVVELDVVDVLGVLAVDDVVVTVVVVEVDEGGKTWSVNT